MLSTFEVLVIIGLLGLNGVFAAYEMALSAVSHARLVALQKSGHRGAAAAVFMKERIERALAVCQLGVTFLAAITAAFGGASVEERLAPYLEQRFGFTPGQAGAMAITAVVIPLAALTIVFAELAPKVLAIRHRERVCCVLSPIMRYIASVVAPVVGTLEFLAKGIVNILTLARRRAKLGDRDETSLHELTAAAALARTSKLIGAREERIVRSAALLSSRELDEIALPASDISVLPIDCTLEDALVRAHLDMHTRFPVARVDGDPQTIEGYVTFKDLVAILKMASGAPATLRAATRPIQRIRATTSIAAALDRMVRERTHISLVVDDAGTVTGMVTLEDIIEELVGDIEDEFDRLPTYVQPTGDGYIVGGGIALETLAQRIGAKELGAAKPAVTSDGNASAPGSTASSDVRAVPSSGVSGSTNSSGHTSSTTLEHHRPLTLADWTARELGHAPKGGEAITRDGITLFVRKLRRKKLAEAFVRKTAEPARSSTASS